MGKVTVTVVGTRPGREYAVGLPGVSSESRFMQKKASMQELTSVICTGANCLCGRQSDGDAGCPATEQLESTVLWLVELQPPTRRVDRSRVAHFCLDIYDMTQRIASFQV